MCVSVSFVILKVRKYIYLYIDVQSGNRLCIYISVNNKYISFVGFFDQP